MNVQVIEADVHARKPVPYWHGRDYKSYISKPRIYVSVAGDTLLDSLAARGTRPPKQFRTLAVPAALAALGLAADTRVTFSHYAGCSMCPCSPGYIVEDKSKRADVWVTLGDPVEVTAQAAAKLEADRLRLLPERGE
jgi:hypothetical protein